MHHLLMTALMRRTGAALLICFGGTLTLEGAAAALDLGTTEGSLTAMRKIQCSMENGQPVTYWWHGRAYSRVPGEADRVLFEVEGMNIRQCGPLTDDANAPSFKQVSREILLYKDPDTGEVLRSWVNPWTEKTVDVIHVANDPVNARFAEKGRDGRPFLLPFSVLGDQWWLTSTVPLFYTNPLGGDFQKYVGGTYHATEMFNFFGDLAALEDEGVDSVPARVGWVRMSKWLPWMEMGDRAGLIYFHTAGRKLDSFDDLSETMKAEIAANYPDYAEPPPLDDERRNETSWSYFKKVLSER
jgi:hypothetical protein